MHQEAMHPVPTTLLILLPTLILSVTPNLSSWMSYLPDNTCLQHLSIPGTHQSLSYTLPTSPTSLDDWSRCQKLPLKTQLESGIRFIDIRARHFHDTFEMHHAHVYLKQNFTSIITTLHSFLTGVGKNELVLMRLKDENHRPTRNTREFAETLEEYVYEHPDTSKLLQDILYLGGRSGEVGGIPKITKETRGKLVLLKNYNDERRSLGKFGSSYNWFDQSIIRIQDDWEIPTIFAIRQKKEKVLEFWKSELSRRREAMLLPGDNAGGDDGGSKCGDLELLINFLSGSGAGAQPRTVAAAMNPWFRKLVSGGGGGGWDSIPELEGGAMGVVAFDFVDEMLARMIVERNF